MKEKLKTVDGGINGGINAVVKYIEAHPGVKGPEIASTFNVPQRTLERVLKRLKDAGKIILRALERREDIILQDLLMWECNRT